MQPGSFASILACPQHIWLAGNLETAWFVVDGVTSGVIRSPKPEPQSCGTNQAMVSEWADINPLILPG
jgi:hypothetical protein